MLAEVAPLEVATGETVLLVEAHGVVLRSLEPVASVPALAPATISGELGGTYVWVL